MVGVGKKKYKGPYFSHQSRTRCAKCSSIKTKAICTKYGSRVKWWKCLDCGYQYKTAGQEI